MCRISTYCDKKCLTSLFDFDSLRRAGVCLSRVRLSNALLAHNRNSATINDGRLCKETVGSIPAMHQTAEVIQRNSQHNTEQGRAEHAFQWSADGP